MTRRHPIALLALTAGALVAAAAWWLTHNPLTADPHPPPASAVLSPAALPDLPATDPEPVELPPRAEEEPPPALAHDANHDHNEDGGFTSRDLWNHINDPANSDLPPDLFAELTQLGVDVVRADATGHGRDRWPHHWAADTGRAEPCCTDITIHAAGAHTHPADPHTVQATIIWTGTNANEPSLVEQTSQIRLQHGPQGWDPAA